MNRNLLHKTWFIELASAIVWAVIFLCGESLVAFLRSEPFPSMLEIMFKFPFLCFWFWLFFYWFSKKKSEMEGECDYHRKKGKEAVLKQKEKEDEQARASYGPRSFRRKTLGLK